MLMKDTVAARTAAGEGLWQNVTVWARVRHGRWGWGRVLCPLLVFAEGKPVPGWGRGDCHPGIV